MKTAMHIAQRLRSQWKPRLISAALAIAASPAYAQFEGPTAKLNTVQQALIGFGATIITCALMWIGYRMVFQNAKWGEVTQIFWGGAIAGAAPIIGAWLFS